MSEPTMSIYTGQAVGNYNIENDCEDEFIRLTPLYEKLIGFPYIRKIDED